MIFSLMCSKNFNLLLGPKLTMHSFIFQFSNYAIFGRLEVTTWSSVGSWMRRRSRRGEGHSTVTAYQSAGDP